ncbi:putative mediator of RNA polymerase II transcription subunit 26 [Frieseomelitta varia]|uniref:putative mediator of RNA polymerase II transcription subunit 26 n=1 Tax=Frieseomelitta varia TaxID=561572 RepID=UPI001CB69843|nr:putative mediator of RNA polymerase II transcription subunit 26 [Frieseomelitta varia]
MNKRKTLADKSSIQKAPSRRPSVSNLQQKPLKPEKLASTHDLVDPSDSSKITNKAADVSLPKIRFNSQDRCKEPRSCSSPRLKYFPSEKIKKLESPPSFSPKPMAALIGQQDPRQAGILYTAGHPEQYRDAGQGDAVQHLQSQGVQNASQQQVVPQQAIHQIGQMNPHSESMLPQQVSNVQSHRPFVPHGSHDYFPQRNSHVASSNPTQGPMTPQPYMQQVTNVSVVDQRKVKSEDLIGTNDLDYEKQPIGGRNAAVYRRTMMSKQQAQPNSQLIALSPPNVNQQNVYSQCSSHGHVPLYRNLQNPQQIYQYQQLQQNMAQQQQMQQKAYQMQMMGNQQQMAGYFPSQGMTSPQDVTASQMRNTRMLGPSQPNYATNHRDLNYTMNPQNRWTMNGQVADHSSIKAQLNPYNVDVVNGNQTLYRPQNQQQQLLPQYQQQPVHQHQMYRNPVQRQQNLNAHNQQMNMNFSQQMVPFQQFNPQQPQDKQPDVQTQRRKPLKFTIGMIRDQDKLLATMKQQGVPMDIMRRQFEILLNEQRKHLEYLELLRQQEESPAVTKTVATNRKRKEQDEKPEWMIHLTPPRLSYVEIEKTYEQRKKQREMEMIQQQQQNEQMASQVSGQQIPVQVTNQQNYQHWQQANWQQQQRPLQNYNHMYSQAHAIPRFGNMNELMKINANNSQSVQQYVHQQPHQQYYNPQIMQQYQQFYQAVPQQNQEQVQSSNQFPKYDDNRSSTEPSSLLKMRRYKKEIRPQKLQNGLQDPEAAKRMLETDAVSSEIRKRLQYLVNLAPKKPVVRLNGMQDFSEAEAEFQNRLITSTLPSAVKRISANGLENSRNPNNPPAQRLLVKKMEQEYVREYPRQKPDMSRNYLQAERENGTTNQPRLLVQQQQQQQLPALGQQQQFPGQNSTSIPYNCGNVMSFKFDGNYPQHYQQMQQYYQNTKNLLRNNGEGDVGSSQGTEQNKGSFDHAGGDASHGNMTSSMNGQITESKMLPEKVYYSQPDIHESKTIGGVRYLARKPDYLFNQQIMIPETLIANRHAQIPMMN